MSIRAAIPTRYPNDYQAALILTLLGEPVESLTLYDNGHDTAQGKALIETAIKEPRVRVMNAKGLPLYAMWNDALQHNRDHWLLLLNDDVMILPGTVGAVMEMIVGYPDLGIVGLDYHSDISDGLRPADEPSFVSGTYRHGGIGGFAFFVAPGVFDKTGEIDHEFVWWCGDDDLVFKAEKAGFDVAIATGVPVFHAPETSAARRPELAEQKGRDLERCLAVHGR